jgi:hydroxymethylglutaryl-CoA reductase
MAIFDQTFAEKVKERVATLDEDVQPVWGTMDRGKLFGHLNKTVQYTIGGGPEIPFKGNFKTKHIFRHVVLFGFKEIPRGIRLPRPEGVPEEQLFPVSDLQELTDSIDQYLEAVKKGGLPTRMHPFFGPLSPKGWQRFHVAHFTHHLKQFGIGDGL